MSRAQVALLGQFEITVDGRSVSIKSSKERALLARLALQPGTVVPTDSLIAAVWPDGSLPDDPSRALRYHVWHLRELLEPHRADRSEGTLVLTRTDGYVLAVESEAVDAVRLEGDWARAVRMEDDPRRRRATLALLLDAWGPACFADATIHGPLADAAVRLDRLRSTILSERIAADLALGRGAELVPELEALVATHPFDERLRGHLMVALYRSGRQADALGVYTATRAVLVEELGVEPGPELRDLEQRILRQDDVLYGPTRSGDSAVVSRDEPRNNLPYPVDSFVGRGNEMAELHRLLSDYRLVTLTGAGGIGKTRLAIEVGRQLVDLHADGVWLAELASVVNDDLVATLVAGAWGLTASESDVEDVLISFLRPRQLVLVLDNCEHVSDAASRLVTRLLREAPKVRILATSRESLGVAGEAAFVVQSLDQGDVGDVAGAAATLFIDRGRAARPSWDPATADTGAINRICARLDGIPLGLELAAGRLRSMAPTEIADHLDQSLGLLAVAAKNGLPRHRTLAATVEWSYQLLSPPEQTMFRRCAVFNGGFDIAAAIAVCGESGASTVDVNNVMDSLVDKSLVLTTPDLDGTRYRVLEPLRQWAHEQLVVNGELDAVRSAHAHHYAQLIADLSPGYHAHGQEVALRRTLTDYPNVRVGLATLAEAGDADRHLDVCFRLFSFWAHQSMHLEGFQTCQRSLALANAGTDLMAQVKTAFVGAVCGAWTRRPDAVAIAARARQLAEQLGNRGAMAWAELALAIVHGNDGLPRGAAVAIPDDVTADPMQRAVDLWATHPGSAWWDPTWERGLQQLCCSIFLPYGPDRLAEFHASQTAFQSVGDRGWLAILYAQSLDHLEFAGADATRRLLEEGAGIEISPSWSHAARYRLGVLHLLLGDHERAVSELTATIAYRQRVGDTNWTSEVRYLAISECELGRLHDAAQLVESVFSTIEHDRGEREVLRTLVVAAHLLQAAAEPRLAARALGRAGGIQDNFVDTIGTVRARLNAEFGTPAVENLIAEGDATDLSQLVAEVRHALANVDLGGHG